MNKVDVGMSKSSVKTQLSSKLKAACGLGENGQLPLSILVNLTNLVKTKVHEGVQYHEQLDAFLKLLETSENFVSSVLMDVDDIQAICAISFADMRLQPPAGTVFAVLTSDVTFGITPPGCGFSKWSFWTLIAHDHQAFLLLSSAIKKEDARTFGHELLLLIKLYPHIVYMQLVIVLDGT